MKGIFLMCASLRLSIHFKKLVICWSFEIKNLKVTNTLSNSLLRMCRKYFYVDICQFKQANKITLFSHKYINTSTECGQDDPHKVRDKRYNKFKIGILHFRDRTSSTWAAV